VDSSNTLKMADSPATDVEAPTGSSEEQEQPIHYSQVAKKSIWQSLWANPKVLFIAFFAS
jgi:hypothetical protein